MSEEALFDAEGSEAPETPAEPTEVEKAEAEVQAEREKLETERPEFLLDKYESIEAQAKAYNELYKKYTEKSTVPDEYEVELPETITELGESYTDAMKKLGLDNKKAQVFVDFLAETVVPDLAALKKEVEEGKLLKAWRIDDTEKASERINHVVGWAKKSLGAEIVAAHQGSASGILFLESQMKAAAQAERIDDAPGTGFSDVADITSEIQRRLKDPRFDRFGPKYDPEFARETRELALQAG